MLTPRYGKRCARNVTPAACACVSNVSLDHLDQMAATRDEISAFVQNRCFAHLVWGSRRADFCEQRGIVYQGFSLLTANQEVLHHPPLIAAATELNATPAQLVFAFARAIV
jgi:diketogulonate reductase-like aldo/keto reductase